MTQVVTSVGLSEIALTIHFRQSQYEYAVESKATLMTPAKTPKSTTPEKINPNGLDLSLRSH
jgi:hypothetical protein